MHNRGTAPPTTSQTPCSGSSLVDGRGKGSGGSLTSFGSCGNTERAPPDCRLVRAKKFSNSLSKWRFPVGCKHSRISLGLKTTERTALGSLGSKQSPLSASLQVGESLQLTAASKARKAKPTRTAFACALPNTDAVLGQSLYTEPRIVAPGQEIAKLLGRDAKIRQMKVHKLPQTSSILKVRVPAPADALVSLKQHVQGAAGAPGNI